MKNLCLSLVLCLITACGAATLPDAGSEGSSNPDSGSPVTDAGNHVTDAGNVVHDAGNVTPDAGNVVTDAGNVTPDAGQQTPDAGTAETDAGADAGVCTYDAGAPNTLTCAKFLTCANASGCDQCCQQGCLNATTPAAMTNANAFVDCVEAACPAGSASNCDTTAATGTCLGKLAACEGS